MGKSGGGNSHQRAIERARIGHPVSASAIPKVVPAKSSGWLRLLAFIEQPFVITGIAILAGVVDIISHVPVLTLCGVLFVLGLHRAGTVAGKPRKIQIPAYVGVFVVVSSGLYGVHVLLDKSTSQFTDQLIARIVSGISRSSPATATSPKAEQAAPVNGQDSSAQPTKPFIVSRPRGAFAMTRDFRSSLPIWVRYNSQYNTQNSLTISPVSLALYLDITSRVATPERIKAYRVAVKTDACEWTDLFPIPAVGNQFFWLQEHGIDKAIPLDFTGNALDYIFQKPISPFDTVSGWLFFDCQQICSRNNNSSTAQFRISFDTFSGKHFDEVIPVQHLATDKGMPQGVEENMTGMNFVIPPGWKPEDLSHEYIRFYSDKIN
jgi:hypothetical protein